MNSDGPPGPNAVAACVVLYHPSQDTVVKVGSYVCEVDRLYLVENTGAEPSQVCRALLSDPKARLVYAADNLGLSAALNAAAAAARRDGYGWLLLMDQDSSFPPEGVRRLLDGARAFAPGDKVAILAPSHRYLGLRWDPSPEVTWEEAPSAITSGSLLNLDAYATIGGFDERFFIDEVDNEYCLRARSAGYRILVTDGVILDHVFGTERTLRIGGISRRLFLHNHERVYYITRNSIYTHLKYRFRPEGKHLRFHRLCRRLIKNILLADRPLASALSCCRGVVDFLRGRWGKRRMI
jgi:rhamnosyltransferase